MMRAAAIRVLLLAAAVGCGGSARSGGTARSADPAAPAAGSDLAGLAGFERADVCRARGAAQPAAESCPLDPANSFNGMPMDGPRRITALFEQGRPELDCCWAGRDATGVQVEFLLLYEAGRPQPSVALPAFAAPGDVVDCLTKLVSLWTFPPMCAPPDAGLPPGAPLAQITFPVRFGAP
jgi:hypothetical protein